MKKYLWDYLFVGAGISSATAAAILTKRGRRCCAIDVRPHLGGNCFDSPSDGSYIHKYGPHVFHTQSQEIIDFLSGFTRWTPYQHSVTAQVVLDGQITHLPFPYSAETERRIGRRLEDQEIVDLFFRGYSEKMWGRSWEDLPASIRNRVPKRLDDSSDYFPGQQVLMPAGGYSRMISQMFEQTELRLSAGPLEWLDLGKRARCIVYTGRVDLIPGVTDLPLEHRTLQITHTTAAPRMSSAVLNFCHKQTPYTRITSYSRLTGGQTPVHTLERPMAARADDLAPFYPLVELTQIERHRQLLQRAKELHPKLEFLGRLATYRYLDMHQAVGAAMAFAERLTG